LPTEVRLATIDDAAEIQAIYEPIVLETAVSFELVPPTVEEFQERITRTLEKTPRLMCEIDGAVAGCTYAGQHRAREAYQGSVEVTVCLNPLYQSGQSNLHGAVRMSAPPGIPERLQRHCAPQ